MPDENRPLNGLLWSKTVEAFATDGRWDEYRRAYRAAGGRSNQLRTTVANPPALNQDRASRIALEHARNVLIREFVEKLESGEVIAFGLPESISGISKQIPTDEWQWLAKGPEKDGSTFSRTGKIWYLVLFYPKTEVDAWREKRRKTEEFWRSGMKLSEWAESNYPDAYRVLTKNWVWVGSIPSKPGEDEMLERCAEAKRLLQQRLHDEISSGRCVLGIPPEEMTDVIRPVSPDVVSQVVSGAYFGGPRPDEVFFGKQWREIRIFPPDRFQTAGKEDGMTSLPKRRPGRKQKWDWDGAVAHLMAIANTPDGLPETQADMERLVGDWFVDNFDDSPAESTIREKVRNWRRFIAEAGN
jgi:hypothetical protein